MTERPLLVVGFVTPVFRELAAAAPAGSVLVVEEPDVARKRDLAAKVAGNPAVAGLIPWAYGAAESAADFVAAHPDLDPVGVVPLVEYGTPFAARLAERYGLPGAGVAAADAMRDKALLREVTARAGIANPQSVTVRGPEEVTAFMAGLGGSAVVLKPANRQAAVGTQVIGDPAEVVAAWRACAEQDEGIFVPDRPMDRRMLAERCVAGQEFSVELLVRAGEAVFANVTGKQLYPGPRPVELTHIVPADIPADLADLLVERTGRVLAAVGFGTGIAHCEWIVEDGEPHLVECAGRIPGDGIMEVIDRAYGINLLLAYFALMKGEELPPLPGEASGGAVVRFVEMEPGVIESIHGEADAREVDGVFLVDITVAPGHRFDRLRSSWDRAGLVMATADTAAEALRRAEKAAGLVRIQTRP
ncbi:ATP-grasp domain-containing protein [Actinokineospora sp. NPDC004072]